MIRRWSQVLPVLTAATLVALGVSPTAVVAQSGGQPAGSGWGEQRVAERPLATRSQLEERLRELQDRVESSDERRWVYMTLTGNNPRFEERLERVGEKPLQLRVRASGFSQDTLTIRQSTVDEVRDLRQRIQTIRRRLEDGDFRQGDRVVLRVPADTSLSGTFSVNRFRELELPGSFRNVDLSGVLYSEIDSVARSVVSKYVREPQVRTRVLWPVAITGGVSDPGYYNLAPGTTLSEALMQAGGPTSDAKLKKIAYRRGNQDLLKARKEEGGQLPVEVITLADLNARAGDELHVPAGGGRGTVLQVLGAVSGVSGTIFALTRIF